MNPNLVKTAELFDEWARKGKAEGMEDGHSPRAIKALERIPLEAGQTILDLGCGNGWATRWMHERAPGGIAHGLDASELMIQRAQAQSATFPNLKFQVGQFEELLIADSSIHHVFSFEALYYSIDLKKALSEIHRVLEVGGTLTIGTDFYEENPQCHGWPDRMQIPMTLLSTQGWIDSIKNSGLKVIDHFRCYDPRPVDPALSSVEQEKISKFRKEIGSLGIFAKKSA